MRQQQVLERLVQQQELVQVLGLLLSCRKQPEQLQRRWLPERGTCSFLRSLMILKKTISGNCQKNRMDIQVML